LYKDSRLRKHIVGLLLLGLSLSSAVALGQSRGLRAPPGEQPVLREIVEQVSPARLEADVRKLVGFGTRHSLSETESNTRGIGAARRWVQSQFEQISHDCDTCLDVKLQIWVVEGEERIPDPTQIVNVLAIQRGATDPDRYVVITGDIDSRVSDPMDAKSDAPGANDNASGLAAVLETARILSKYKFSASIVYAALSGEEQGLFGGKAMASKAVEDGWRIDAVLNNDMIGNIRGINGIIDNTHARIFSEGTRVVETPEEAKLRRFQGGEVDSPSRNLARYVDQLADRYIPNLDTMLIYRLDRFGRGGHHRPFNEQGFPAVRIMEANENYNRQHQDVRVEKGVSYGDVISGVDFNYASKLTALNAISLASLAWAPPAPTGVTIQGAVSPDTTLTWESPARRVAPHLAGYRIYWRLTDSPVWTDSIYVGNVNSFVLKDLVIDNYFFGVAAVSQTGFESPVVFPGPAGAFGKAAGE
jgi:hypothetical protein